MQNKHDNFSCMAKPTFADITSAALVSKSFQSPPRTWARKLVLNTDTLLAKTHNDASIVLAISFSVLDQCSWRSDAHSHLDFVASNARAHGGWGGPEESQFGQCSSPHDLYLGN